MYRSGDDFVTVRPNSDRTGSDHTAEMADSIVGTVFFNCSRHSISQDRRMSEVSKVVGPAHTIQKQVPIKEPLTPVVQIV